MPAPPPAQGWTSGSVIDGYRLERRLGGGGMGEVWGAVQLATGSLRVIKTLLPGATPVDQERLAREGRALAALEGHPNLLRVHSSGQAHGRGYLVLDYAPGGDLLERLKRGPLEPEQARSLIATLADALGFVHARGLFHRDLKPQNVLFDEHGRPLLADFGLVRGVRRSSLTQSADVIGTPAYMAPEQALGGEVDARTDVYGLGAVLYHALTGRPPFQGNSLIESMRQVLEDAPRPPSEAGLAVPRDLELICLKALAKDPAARFRDTDELRDALLGRRAPSPAGRRRWPLLLASAGAVASACLGAYLLVAASSTTPPESDSLGAEAPSPLPAPPPAADPASQVEAQLEQLYARLPDLELVLADTPPEDRVSHYVRDAAAYRIRAVREMDRAEGRLLAPAPEIARLLQAAMEAGDFRAAGYLGKLLVHPEAEALWPDASQREAMARHLGFQSAEAGCLVATLWVAEAMANGSFGFTRDASRAQALYAGCADAPRPSTGYLAADRRTRVVILRLARMAPATAPPRSVQVEHLLALFEPELWEPLNAREQSWLLAYWAELRQAEGEAQLAALAASPIDPEIVLDPVHRELVRYLTPEDLAQSNATAVYGAGSALAAHVRAGACDEDPAATLRLSATLLCLASDRGARASSFDLHLILHLANRISAPWALGQDAPGETACLERGHTRDGDERASAQLASDALNWDEQHLPGVPCDPVRARRMLEPVDPAPIKNFRVLSQVAEVSARLHLYFPHTVGSPFDRAQTRALLERALGHSECEAGPRKRLEELLRSLEPPR
ncbi:MAG: serine/threonine-protein kinase [Planctomycetota bacterium]